MDGIAWFSTECVDANKDENTIVTNQLTTPLTARAVRICPCPLKWNNHISMRAEVYILDDQ